MPSRSENPGLRVVALASAADHIRDALRIPAEVIAVAGDSGPEMLAALGQADILVSGTFKPGWKELAPHLRLIQGMGAGYDGIALEAVPDGCQVANVYGHDYGIAEYVFMTMAALNRELIASNDGLRHGQWLGGPLRELRGRSVLVVGLGRIGSEVVRWAHFIGMHASALTEHPTEERGRAAGLDAIGSLDDLEAFVKETDFVVIAVPHSDVTTGLVNERVLAAMRPTAYLINVGRGPVVDQWALYSALKEGRIAGAAIDVWYHYPEGADDAMPSDAPLHELPNVIMTPHTAGYTEGTMRHRWIAIAENIRRLAAGEPLANVVWPKKP